MGQIKNIKLHIVTDIKDIFNYNLVKPSFQLIYLQYNTMANTIEKPAATAQPVEDKVEKETSTEPESTTPDETATEENGQTEKQNGNGQTEEQNGNDQTEEEANVQVESSKVDDAEEKDEATLKRKDSPVDTDESLKKKKLV